MILNMDRAALRDLLEAEGVSTNAYRLDGRMEHDALTLERAGNGWCVYYSERGQRGSEWRFATEDEACTFLADALLSDAFNRFQSVAIGVPSEADAAFEVWLAEHGISRHDLADDEIRIDSILYAAGIWYRRYFVRRTAIRRFAGQ